MNEAMQLLSLPVRFPLWLVVLAGLILMAAVWWITKLQGKLTEQRRIITERGNSIERAALQLKHCREKITEMKTPSRAILTLRHILRDDKGFSSLMHTEICEAIESRTYGHLGLDMRLSVADEVMARVFGQKEKAPASPEDEAGAAAEDANNQQQ